MFEKVKKIIVDETGVDGAKITMEASFKDDLGIDSLDIFEMVMTFEDELGVEISNEDLENISTVGQFVAYLEKLA